MARTADHPVNPLFTDRWSPRSFSNEALSKEQLLTLLEAARWAPSATNAQPWRFIYALRDTPQWNAIFATVNPFNQKWARAAGALVVVASATEMMAPGKTEPSANHWHAFDAGAAWAQLGLQAVFSGLAAHAIGGFDSNQLRSVIGLPDDHAINAIVFVGKRAPRESLPPELQEREAPSGRHPLSTIAFEGVFKR